MRQEPEGHESDHRAKPHREAQAPEGSERLFPYNTVVGVIDDASGLEAAVDELLTRGFTKSMCTS